MTNYIWYAQFKSQLQLSSTANHATTPLVSGCQTSPRPTLVNQLGSLPPTTYHTSSTPLMHPSFSGLFVICAYLLHTTLPPGVTRPNSLTFTSMIVPFVIMPNDVAVYPFGFFFKPTISKLNVAFNSGCVIWALFIRRPVGLMKRSYLGGLRVNC